MKKIQITSGGGDFLTHTVYESVASRKLQAVYLSPQLSL